ncbi:MAG: hypothetical protein F4Y44_01935 [Chloroflexi bacterium]|nr:hypothetical protein [Chloroflexota bacterium]
MRYDFGEGSYSPPRGRFWACAFMLLFAGIVITACGRAPGPIPTAASSVPPNPYGPFSLDERIFFADTIAIVRQISSEAGVLTVEGQNSETLYSPVVQSRFEVIEFLKGDGDSEIVMDKKDLRILVPTDEQALQTAERDLTAQPSVLESGEAVVFLQSMQYSDWVLDTSLKASGSEWRQHSSQAGLFSAGGASATFSIASGVDAAASAGGEAFSIDELRERIEAMDALLRDGEGIEGWKECIGARLLRENQKRTYLTRQGEELYADVYEPAPFPSGKSADFILDIYKQYGSGFSDKGYDRHWFTGEDSHLFRIVIVENGQIIEPNYIETREQQTFYELQVRITRPIPEGIYEINHHSQWAEWALCNYLDTPATNRYIFESAADTLHEVFFDPVALGAAVGADSASGVLKPASFASDGGDATIERIDWLDGQVRMSLAPHTALPDHHIDFIALDGSVSLRLDFDDAVEVDDADGNRTLIWGVCEQPWQPGDLLMLRIAAGIPADLAGATFNEDCAPSPQFTPTPAP